MKSTKMGILAAALLLILLVHCNPERSLIVENANPEIIPVVKLADLEDVSEIDSAVMVVSGNDISKPLYFDLVVDKVHMKLFGSVKLPQTIDQCSLTVKIFDKERRKIGQGSSTISKKEISAGKCIVGPIEIFSAKPRISGITASHTSVKDSSVTILWVATDSFGGEVIKQQWRLGSGEWKDASKSNFILDSSLIHSMICSLRVTDDEGNATVRAFGIWSLFQRFGQMVRIPAQGKNIQISRPQEQGGNLNVTFTEDFFIDTAEVTVEDYAQLRHNTEHLVFITSPRQPIGAITWYDALLYCNERSKRNGLDTVYSYSGTDTINNKTFKLHDLTTHTEANGFRLPSEAQWEFACRAGTQTDFYWGYVNMDDYAWSRQNTDGLYAEIVAQKVPNAFGLYDMSGNAWEWCSETFGTAPPMAVQRGGSIYDYSEKLKSSYRNLESLTASNPGISFRPILPVKGAITVYK